jgi:HKD family nuclease
MLLDTISEIVSPVDRRVKIRIYTSPRPQMKDPVFYREILSSLYETDQDMCFPDKQQADFWIKNYSGYEE